MLDWRHMPQFRGFDLSESYVLGWDVGEDIVFEVEFALTCEHPAYHPPRPGVFACYERGRLRFPRVRTHIGLRDVREVQGALDASGGRDYGNFDALAEGPDGFHLEGDFGTVAIVSDAPQPELTL